MALKLYDFPLSGHSHRARLFISLLNLDAEIVFVDLASGEHKQKAFLEKNPFGQVPVLEDDGVYIADSNAILVYLAKKFNKTDWLPEDAKQAAEIQRWLSVAAGQIAYGPCAARLNTLFGASFNEAEVSERAHTILQLINTQLSDKRFIIGENITIADIALYSYIANAPEGNIDLADYVNIKTWLTDIEKLPGFHPFPQSPVGLRKVA